MRDLREFDLIGMPGQFDGGLGQVHASVDHTGFDLRQAFEQPHAGGAVNTMQSQGGLHATTWQSLYMLFNKSRRIEVNETMRYQLRINRRFGVIAEASAQFVILV